ncbi:hypothetical protein AWV80_06510 [Cupriavidus sp. UYMU48A]|nr:hypothetical protein AWV80_06510 [Cupriavidus sp. UYMU48A]
MRAFVYGGPGGASFGWAGFHDARFLTPVVGPATSRENECRVLVVSQWRLTMTKSISDRFASEHQSDIESGLFIPPPLDEPISHFSPETLRAARMDALPIPRQLLLLNLLDQATSVVRGAACVLTLLAQSDCDAQDEGIVALRSTSADALRGLCQSSLALLADRISEVGEGIEAAAAA